MVARAEQILNAAETTLNGSISNSATSIVVTDGSIYPAEGDYRLIIEEEIVLVTTRSSNTLTAVRGAEGTNAVSHANATKIHAVATQGGYDQYVRDFIDPTAFDRVPNRLLDINDTTLTKSSFTSLNNGSSVITDETHGGISIAMDAGAAPDARVLHKSAPSTPYKVTAHVLSGIGSNAAAENANVLGFRESSSGKLSFISYHYGTNTFTQYLTSPTSSAGAPANSSSQNIPFRADYWLQIEHDGTDLFYRISADGYNWWEQHTEDDAFWFDASPDELWWGGDNQGVDGEFIHLLAWIEETA